MSVAAKKFFLDNVRAIKSASDIAACRAELEARRNDISPEEMKDILAELSSDPIVAIKFLECNCSLEEFVAWCSAIGLKSDDSK